MVILSKLLLMRNDATETVQDIYLQLCINNNVV